MLIMNMDIRHKKNKNRIECTTPGLSASCVCACFSVFLTCLPAFTGH